MELIFLIFLAPHKDCLPHKDCQLDLVPRQLLRPASQFVFRFSFDSFNSKTQAIQLSDFSLKA